MPRKTDHSSNHNDNSTNAVTIDFDQLVKASGLDKDTLLHRIAETLSKRDEGSASDGAPYIGVE